MYNNCTKPFKQYPESGISLKYKLRRLPMEKKTKVCALCGLLVVTLLYFVYSLHHNMGEASPFYLGVAAQLFVENSCPITKPVRRDDGLLTYRIAIISDLDENSKHPDKLFTWFSYMKRGKLVLRGGKSGAIYSVSWDSDDIQFTSSLAQGGRGMELSELTCFDGQMLSIDDRTGVVYKISDRHVSPWVVMADGDGTEAKGFKGEWATVKDGELFVGGLGKAWTSKTGDILNFNPQYVKIISPSGAMIHVNWVANYKKILKTVGITPPGYLIHESASWSGVNKKWYFLPRRASKLKYNDKLDEQRGTNMLISCSEDFKNCDMTLIGPLNLTHGFSSFKFVPGTNEQQIVALKTEEVDGKISSYIMAFDVSGRILMEEQKIPGSYKFEGIEFL